MHESVERIVESSDALREQQARDDEAGKLTDATLKILQHSGGLRLLQPKSLGGYEESPLVFGEWVRAVGRANSAAGWVAGVVGVHPFHIAYMDERLRNEVYGDDPETLTATPGTPAGKVTRVDGGYRFSTQVGYSTGCDHAEWFILVAVLVDEDGQAVTPRQVVEVTVPRADVEIIDGSWNMMGLMGSGSNTIRVRDAFVPAYRTLDSPTLYAGGYADRQAPGSIYGLPYSNVFCYAISSGLFGLAGGFLDRYTEYLRARVGAGVGAAKTDPYQQRAFTNAVNTLESSIVHVDAVLDDLLAAVRQGRTMTVADRVRFRAAQVTASQRVISAINELYQLAGSAGRRTGQPIEQYFRDFQVGASHFGVDPAVMYAPYVTVILDPDADIAGAF
jgi:alkylation response protein AidB-like acyl-CoA dehydrogenase